MKYYFSFFALIIFLTACKQAEKEPVQTIEAPEVEAVDPTTFISSPVQGTSFQRLERRDSDGNLLEEGYLLNGKRSGTWVVYHPESVIPKQVISYVDDQYHGIYLEFNVRGNLDLRAGYRDNLLHGPWATYRFGRPTAEANYEDGKLNGIYREYVMNTGKLQKEITYKAGVLDGPYRFFDDQGKVVLEYDYKNGERVATKYDKEGSQDPR